MITALCPSGSKTGGAENLHQLICAFRSHGSDACISYFPDPSGKGTGEHFEVYNVPAIDPHDHEDNILIIPENSTFLLKRYPRSKKVVFWLSVDNYLNRKGDSWRTDIYKYFRSLQTTRVRLAKMKQHLHISQSIYATQYLANHGYPSFYIGDYLNDDFTSNNLITTEQRLDQVLYNPKKGSKYIQRLKGMDSSINFKPIVNMTREEVYTTMRQSKIYIDLGLHPGKDRIPREAVTMGCCIITCKKGSAGNPYDVPISSKYKFDLSTKSLKNVVSQIRTVFSNYEQHRSDFKHYRNIVQNEKKSFMNNTKNLLEVLLALHGGQK